VARNAHGANVLRDGSGETAEARVRGLWWLGQWARTDLRYGQPLRVGASPWASVAPEG
jgi:hypothetical protein